MKKLLALALSLSSLVLVGAALGAAPASATGAWCSTAPESHICPSKYPQGTKFKAESVGGIVFNTGTQSNCSGSTLEGSMLETEWHETAVKWSSIKFSGCEVEALNLGSWTFPWEAGTHNSKISGQSYVKFPYPSLGITCYYWIPGLEPTAKLIGGSPARIEMRTQIERAAGSNTFFCSPAGTMSAEYKVTSPSPLYVEKE